MPADSTRNTLLRQWELLRLLPAHGAGLSADALCKELEASGFTVSKRQVERDLKALSEIFPLDCNEKGIPYGWRWTEGRSDDLPGIALTDAISLRVVEETLRPLLPGSVLKAVEPRFRQAAMKLEAMADGNLTAHWVDKVRTVSPTLPLLPPRITPEHLECIQNALLADEQIEVEYQARSQVEAKTLTLNPLGLIQSGPVTYLVATAFTYSEPRLFAVHRVSSARRLHQRIEPRSDFDLDAFIRSGVLQFGGGKAINLEARISKGLARIIEETPLSEDQTLELVGETGRVFATVLDTPQLHWWILSQGAGIEVLAPTELRTLIASKLAEASEAYV